MQKFTPQFDFKFTQAMYRLLHGKNVCVCLCEHSRSVETILLGAWGSYSHHQPELLHVTLMPIQNISSSNFSFWLSKQ